MGIIEDNNMFGNKLQFVFEFFLDVCLHCVGENVAVFHHRQVDAPSVSRIKSRRLNAAIKPGFIASLHVGQNSLHTMIGIKLADSV